MTPGAAFVTGLVLGLAAAGESRESTYQAAIAEARRRTALRLSVGRGLR